MSFSRHRWIGWLLIIAFGVLVIRSFTNFRSLVTTLLHGDWPWLLAAVGVHLIYFVPYALMYRLAFSTVDVQSRLRDLVPLLFASIFANAVVPSGGASAVALFVDDAARRGQSGTRAAIGTVLVLLADLATLIPFLLFGIAALIHRHALRVYDTLGAVIFLTFIAVLCSALLLARWRRGWLTLLLDGARRLINRVGRQFHRPEILAERWADENASELCEAAGAIGRHPKRVIYTLALALLVHVISLASLYLVFRAYRQPVALGPLTAGFGMGIVFWVIAVVPQGVGATEGIMTLVFIAFGVPRARAVTIALVFRGVNFYLPLLIGFFMLRRIRAFGIGRSVSATDDR